MGYIDVSAEVITFILSLLLGAFLCFLYDILRVFHKIWFKGFLEVLVTDLLFWLFASFLTFCFLILRCKGSVRGFVIFGCLIGFIIVRLTISKILISVFNYLFIKFYHIFSYVFHKTNDYFIKIFRKIHIVLKKLLQDNITLLYNQLKCVLFKNKGDRNRGSSE